mmetsp:Transcript_16726/g.21130  ORF Transcript_16726/g.21130 Transcript_16726/m.21130 type:complete len:108 (+) Transcript_16726:1163-1486(+)
MIGFKAGQFLCNAARLTLRARNAAMELRRGRFAIVHSRELRVLLVNFAKQIRLHFLHVEAGVFLQPLLRLFAALHDHAVMATLYRGALLLGTNHWQFIARWTAVRTF